MTIGGEAGEHERDLLVLTEDDPLDVREQAIRSGRVASLVHASATVSASINPDR